MPKFFYIARDKTGKKVSEFEEAVSQDELVLRLQAKDFIVINVISEDITNIRDFKAKSASKRKIKPEHSQITNEDLVLFCRQLATLLGAGVTILKSLEILGQQVASRKLYNVIKDLQRNMEAGLSLHEAMAKHPKAFTELWVNLVESGEASGNLALVLTRLAGYLERNSAFTKKIISALIYPVILMVAGFGALFFLTVKIIPTFANLFAGFNLKLPFLTQVLIIVSDFTRKYIMLIMGITITLVILFKRYIATKDGRRKYETFKFALPMFGEFFQAMVVERFSSEMSTLIESGVPILYSLEITEHGVGNLVLSDILRKIKEEVREGKSLSVSLDKSGFFEPMFVQMVTIGEEIGELSEMFKKINSFYQEYVEMFLGRLTTMFEPLMMIFMGLVIGIMVIGMFLPIFQLTKVGG